MPFGCGGNSWRRRRRRKSIGRRPSLQMDRAPTTTPRPADPEPGAVPRAPACSCPRRAPRHRGRLLLDRYSRRRRRLRRCRRRRRWVDRGRLRRHGAAAEHWCRCGRPAAAGAAVPVTPDAAVTCCGGRRRAAEHRPSAERHEHERGRTGRDHPRVRLRRRRRRRRHGRNALERLVANSAGRLFLAIVVQRLQHVRARVARRIHRRQIARCEQRLANVLQLASELFGLRRAPFRILLERARHGRDELWRQTRHQRRRATAALP